MQRSFSRHVRHSPAQMMALVSDVESYPHFIPHCEQMVVRRDRLTPETNFDATMHIRFGPIAQAYTSRIVADPAAGTLRAKAIDGPFSHLDSLWRFTAREHDTLVEFDIDFRIANPLIRAVAEPAFAAKQEEIMDAFIAEAEKRYG